VHKVLRVDRPENAHPLAAIFAPQIAALAADYTHVFGPSTSFGKDLMPRVAALLGVPQVSDLMAVESAYRFRRPIYAGNAIITVEADPARKLVATVRVASFEAAAGGGAPRSNSEERHVALPSHTRYIGAKSGSTDRPDLQTAARRLGRPRARQRRELQAAVQLADKIGAAVGASRAAVDAGYAPNEMQVGQTGKIISPEIYIAIGISGRSSI
jgi:electron transfer flavoprotein alpha subunit